MCARCSLRPARVYLFVFPTHCLHHSFLSLSFIPPPPFVRSLNPSHLVLISVAFSLPLALSHKNMHMHPSIHPHTQLARASPRQAARFGVGLCKEIQKKKKNSVRRHCLMVSPWQLREHGPTMRCQTKHRILNLSKEMSFVQ